MQLSKEIYRDGHSGYTKEFNDHGLPIFEGYNAPYHTRSKTIAYNDKKKVTSILEITKGNGQDSWEHEDGFLTIYEYSGDNYRVITYKRGTRSYADFTAQQDAAPVNNSRYAVEEAFSVQECKFENGLLISEHYHNQEEGEKHAVNYSYKDGMKASETRINGDGTKQQTNYNYENGVLKLKSTFINNQFSDMVIYLYKHNLLSEEQKVCKHNDIQYLSSQKKYFYNDKNEIEKTAYYGRYDSKMHLYKTEETIREGNVLTKKHAVISSLETMTGYYDLAALHAMLKRENMEWYISMFDEQYLQTAVFDAKSCKIEKYDDKGNVIEEKHLHPESHTEELYGRILCRNEYNDKSQLEFIICYAMTHEGKMEERSIRKFYYHG